MTELYSSIITCPVSSPCLDVYVDVDVYVHTCLLIMARYGELIQMQHFCQHGDIMRHPISSYVTTKLHGTSTCGCNHDTIFRKGLFPRFLSSMYAENVNLAATNKLF